MKKLVMLLSFALMLGVVVANAQKPATKAVPAKPAATAPAKQAVKPAAAAPAKAAITPVKPAAPAKKKTPVAK